MNEESIERFVDFNNNEYMIVVYDNGKSPVYKIIKGHITYITWIYAKLFYTDNMLRNVLSVVIK